MKALIKDIRIALDSFSDSRRKEFAKSYYPTAMEVIGVTVPNLKIVLKELKQQTKSYSEEEKLQLIKLLVDQDVFEMQQLAFEYFQANKNLSKLLSLEFVESIEKNLDNWISVDYFSAIVVGVAWRENLISTEKIKSYLSSEDFWIRRIAVVSTIALNQKARGGQGDAKRTLEICELVVNDHADMINKALSWALRELSKRDRSSVEQFVTKYKDKLHPRVKREVTRKLTTGTKN